LSLGWPFQDSFSLWADFVAEVGDCSRSDFLDLRKRSLIIHRLGGAALTKGSCTACLGKTYIDHRRWPDDQLGEPAQVLCNGCQSELVLCAARATKP
jgi:hypothetical protein